MGSGPAISNTGLEGKDRRRLESAGPYGFIKAVHQTLGRIGRPYYYAAEVPPWFGTDEEASAPTRPVPEILGEKPEGPIEREWPDPAKQMIIHTFRRYPAKRRFAGTTDNASGSRRQKTPNEVTYHDRPLPEPYEENDEVDEAIRPAAEETRDGPPLWDSIDQVPDMFREEVDADTRFYVTSWSFDVFVDFLLVAPNMHDLQRMETDVELILRTFHSRFDSGASNLKGWFYEAKDQAPTGIDTDRLEGFPTRTITWRLKQVIGYAFPVNVLNEIHMDVYGTPGLR